MKICAIICEFNPFHNGHKHLIAEAKRRTGCDAVLCVMSGSFTQRGDIAVLSKYERAKHAVLGGADIVVELPVHFSIAPADIFAMGAVKIAKCVDNVEYLAFGCDHPSTDFSALAKFALQEDDEFKKRLTENLQKGQGYAAAYSAALGADAPVSPNDILALEYTKANIKLNANLSLCPIQREGSSYDDSELKGTYASARAIREHRNDNRIYDYAPKEVCDMLMTVGDNEEAFKTFALNMLFVATPDRLRRLFGCTEGLENRIKKYCTGLTYDELVNVCSNKRYSKTRIKRIICANALSVFADDATQMLKDEVPVDVLAVKKERASELLPLVRGSKNLEFYAGISNASTKTSYALWKFLSSPDDGKDLNGKTKLV